MSRGTELPAEGLEIPARPAAAIEKQQVNLRRPGLVGRPPGPSAKTRNRIELYAVWREKVAERMELVVDAQMQLALGSTHLLVRDDDGRWSPVPDDPVKIADALNGPAEKIRLESRMPHPKALSDILDRLFGQPAQSIDVTVTKTSKLSDAELHARLQALMGAALDAEPVIDVPCLPVGEQHTLDIHPAIDGRDVVARMAHARAARRESKSMEPGALVPRRKRGRPRKARPAPVIEPEF